ncbi:MAG TPA: AAA family ATPase, partial [Elusimicrobiota bacterium]|nr:AAA family ATPase [Elusimicrobiota bacterium]
QEGSHEYGNIRDVLENLVRFPWLKRTRSPLPALAEVDPRLRADEFRRAGRQILQNARRHLDESHYGMNEAKEEIEDYLAEQIQRERHGKRGTGKVLCLVGPAGVGKSTLGESIAKALGREFGRVPLGGTRDPAEIRGHSPTYQGAMPGNIVQTLQKLQVKNPVILLDEIEKMDSGIQGNPADVLLQALDEEQNDHFTDHNIGDVDLSEVLFIATANEEDKIPEALKDRMEIVRLPAYDRAEKIAIGTDKLLPRVMRDLGVSPEQVQTPRPQELMTHLVDGYTQEPGVRELSKQLTRLVKRALTDVYLAGGRPVVLTPEAVRGYMGLPRRGATARASSEVGEAVGLVISPRGGGTINIQADARPANNPEAPIEIVNFGQLQADMLFSVETALSYLRKNAVRLGLPPAAMKGQRLLINISPGDVKKDGPSAGIGFVATIFSSLTGQPLRQDFAMTGQVDDEGKVYPIGGLKEKILAALEDRASTVILPVGNKEELIKTIFVQSPDLKGVIEENGLQRITVEQKKPAGNQTGPTAEDSTWEALNTLLTTKAQRFGLVAESDRLGALTLAGTPDQMRSFLSDSDVMKNVSYPVTYLIVSHVDEALKALRAAGNDESSGGTKPTLPLTGPALGGVLTAFLAGLAYSPESSAAPLVQSLATAGTLSFASLAPVLLLTGWMALKWIARRWNTTVLSRNTLHRMTISLGGALADLAGKGLVGLFEFGGFLRRGPGEAPSPLGGGLFADLRDIQTMENQYPLLAAALSTAARHHWFSRGPLSLTTSVSTRALAGFTERMLAAGDTRRIRYPYAARAAGAGFRPTPRTKNATDEGLGSPQRLGVLLHGVSEGLPSDLIDWRLKNMEGLDRGEWPNADSLRTLLDFLRGDSWKSPSYEGLEEERREFVRAQIVEIRRSLYARLALEAARADPLEGRKVWETGKTAESDARVTERSSGDGWRGAADALALRPAVVHSREAIVLDAELLKAAAAEDVARLVAAGRYGEGENAPLVVVVSERDSTDQLKALIPADRWGLSAQRILTLGFDGLSKANAIEFAPGGRRVKMEALKSEMARQTGGGNGQAFRLTLWAASGRAEIFDGDLVRLIAVEQDLLLEGAAATAFVERLRQLFGSDEAAQMIRDLSPDGTGRVIRLPGRSPLLQETINAIQTDLLIQTNA